MSDKVWLAHAGGAPEALTLGLPLLIFCGFLWLERRARARERKASERPEATDGE